MIYTKDLIKLLKGIGRTIKENKSEKMSDIHSVFEKVNLNNEFLCGTNKYKNLGIKIIYLIRNSNRKEKVSTNCLNEIFDISEEEIMRVKCEYDNSEINKDNLLFDEEDNELDDSEREKLINGEYIRGNMNIKYHNNPLYKPITKYENKLIVEVLIIISEYISELIHDIGNVENEEIIINLRIFGDYRNMMFVLLMIFIYKIIF